MRAKHAARMVIIAIIVIMHSLAGEQVHMC